MSVVYAHDNPDLQDFCAVQGIRTSHYPLIEPREETVRTPSRPFDVRRDPDPARRRAFLSGWTRAVNGELFGSIHNRKTHANMGNLFGWVYGDQPEDFRLETWARYVEHSETSDTDSEEE
jgi:hypothetical protein